jgi:preprotein translocase subunit SecA
VSESIEQMRWNVIDDLCSNYIPPNSVPDEWDIPAMERVLGSEFGLQVPISQWMEDGTVENGESIRDKVLEDIESAYLTKREGWVGMGIDADSIEKRIMLSILDQKWKEHIVAMEHLRQGIHLRGYAQKQPKQEYKRESFLMFEEMLTNREHEVVRMLSRGEIQQDVDRRAEEVRRQEEAMRRLKYLHESSASNGEQESSAAKPFVREKPKVGRNSPCPCGSGKKFKNCCGRGG